MKIIDFQTQECTSECPSICATCEGAVDHCTSRLAVSVLVGNACKGCQEGCKACDYNNKNSISTSCSDCFALCQTALKCEKWDSSRAACCDTLDGNHCFECPIGH